MSAWDGQGPRGCPRAGLRFLAPWWLRAQSRYLKKQEMVVDLINDGLDWRKVVTAGSRRPASQGLPARWGAEVAPQNPRLARSIRRDHAGGRGGGGGSNPLPFMLQAFKMLFTGEGPEHPAMLPRLSLSFLKQEAQLGGVGTCLTT